MFFFFFSIASNTESMFLFEGIMAKFYNKKIIKESMTTKKFPLFRENSLAKKDKIISQKVD